MNSPRQAFSKLRYLLLSRRTRREFDDEINAHIEMLTERFLAQGMTHEDARNAARRQLGNLTSIKETRNDMQTWPWLDTWWQDLRHGARLLVRNKGFAVVAVLTLALGIGANTAIFSVVNAAILRPLPYPDPGRLVVLWGNVKRVRIERRGASYPDFRDWRTQSRSFSALAAFDDSRFALTGIGASEQIPGEYVSQPYFALLGISAQLGRTFSPEEDDVPLRNPVAVLSDGAWKRLFGADPAIVGHQIQLEGRAYTVVGVAPPGFRGLSDQAEVWVPFTMAASAADFAERGNRGFKVLARLRRGVSLSRAQAEMDGISSRLARAYPTTNEARGVEVSPLTREFFGDLRRPLLVLMAAVAFVLLIAATNVANLLLARSESRQHEMVIRLALGAGRGRLMRQLLAESAVLVAFGCAAGLALAHYGIRALLVTTPLQFPTFVHPTLDASVALFTVVVCCGMVLAFGMTPAAQACTTAFDEAIKQGAGRSTGSRRGARFRDALVVAELSISMLLLIGAGLMMRSLNRLAALDPGYDPDRVLQLRVSLPQMQPSGPDGADKPDAAATAAAGGILRNIAALPSVESAALATDAPLAGGYAVFYAAEGQGPVRAESMPRAYFHRVSPDFFHTLKTRFLFGRGFSEDEVHGKADVAIVTENLVNRFWHGQNPIGKRIKVGGASSTRPWLTIVGVVPDLNYRGLPRNPTSDPDLFQVFNERSRDFSVLVRTALPPTAMLAAIRSKLQQTEPAILIYDTATLEALVRREMSRPRFTGWLMTLFAGIALALSLIGIYGVISYAVGRRTREIGLRMALGAGRREVLRVVLGRGLTLVLAGMLAGVAAALALTRMLTTLIYNVSATDPVTFAAAAALLMAVALLACFIPALRASRIDPASALRNE
jgi:predicted permease